MQDPVTQCASCGAPLAADQRYCLECGEPSLPRSSFLFGDPGGAPETSTPASPPPAPVDQMASGGSQRGNWLLVIAGVGVLLIAMGVGVLIGRANSSTQPAAAQVITVGATPAAGTPSTGATGTTSEGTFTSDWTSGATGYTVQLQMLPQSNSTVSQVQAAKSAASAKGATGVGALSSAEYSSLTAGNYVIYSGDYKTKPEAEKALASLKKSFPAASVINVANASGSSTTTKSSPSSHGTSPAGGGSSKSSKAPPTKTGNPNPNAGKNYEEKSKNLPDVVETE
jgi:SPOR domain